jgi:hypothetical protein
MPTSLKVIRSKLVSRLRILNRAFDRQLHNAGTSRSADRYALREGLISGLWQTWGSYCRTIIIESARGAIDGGGAAIASPYTANSEMEVAFVARQLAQRSPVGTIRPLAGNHQEPTWGDLAKLNLIVSGLGTSNHNVLLSSFGAALRIRDLQLCRNACAHICADRMADLSGARVRYTSSSLTHPTDFIIWVDPTTSDFVWHSWTTEMETVSALISA